MDAIVFGTGVGAKNILAFLEKKYHILFFVDNNETKWGSTFENYKVESPDEVSKYTCDVVISSTIYDIEIAEQLRQMGVNQERIYFGHRVQTKDSFVVEVYPLIEQKMLCEKAPLIQYDLLHTEEEETDCRKVLIFCRYYSVYTKQLIENISKRYGDIKFSLLTTEAEENGEKIVSEQLIHIYNFQTMGDLKTILEQIPVYDAMHLLFMEKEWAYFYRLIRLKTHRLNLNVGGSDFYRSGEVVRNYKKNLIACADRVMAQTEATVQEFVAYYGEEVKNKTHLLPYGVEVLDYINKSDVSKKVIREKYHIPVDKIMVTCGHNASEAHQHMRIIDAIECLDEKVKEQIVCVFPMTYPQGMEDYVNRVDSRLKESALEYVILTEFMDFQEMAEYAQISDIMIHVQITDQLSSAMLEEMYAGSVIIAGEWLPYRSLHEMGIFFIDVESIADITSSMNDIIGSMEAYKRKCAGNREIIWKHSSWDELSSKWRSLWD